MSRWGWSGVIVLVMGWCASQADARMRDYLVNQSYYTATRGDVEVELYNDMRFSEADNDDSYNSKHQIELEYGVLDHLQLGYYEVYTWDRANDWERDAFKIEAKLRLAEAGQWPVDVAFYTEYKNPNGARRVHSDELENKIILSKDLGPWNVIGNVIFEKPLNNGEPWAFEYTAGVSYALTARTRVALEVQEALGDSDWFGGLGRRELLLIPSVAANLTPHIRVLAGPAFGLTRRSDDLQLRSIVEIEL